MIADVLERDSRIKALSSYVPATPDK
jgi:hypothetical protein